MLQYITHKTNNRDEIEGVRLALRGGCRWIQLRMKDASNDEILEAAHSIKILCRQFNATFIIDDHVELVKTIGADGVHLGKNDMPVETARELLGKGIIIGATANSFDDIIKAANAGADYIGLGPYRFTETKKKLSPVLGLDGYRCIMKKCQEARLSLPVIAIGGIGPYDIPQLMSTGISGIAVSGTILRAGDPVATTQQIINLLNQTI